MSMSSSSGDSTKSIGDKGEKIAARFLEEKGYRVMDANYRFQRKEVDLVCFDPQARQGKGELVFVEVKTRSGLGYGPPDAAVDEAKQQNVADAARAYLYERRLEGSPARFDVVAILLNQGDSPTIKHFTDAFTA